MKKSRTEYFCPSCKRIVDFEETKGEIGGTSPLLGVKLRSQAWPKTSRYHLKCGQVLVELQNKRKK